jgi:subtilisin family serine protease
MRSAYRRQISGWALTVALASLPALGAVTAGDTGPVGPELRFDQRGGYASTHIVVKFSRSVLPASAEGRPLARGVERPEREPVLSPALREASDEWGVTRIRPFYPYEFGNPELAAELGLDQLYILEVPKGTDTPAMAAAFREFGLEIDSAGPEIVGGIALMPDDTEFDRQWNMHNDGSGQFSVEDADIDAPEAWDIHTGNDGSVIIAIIDSGVGTTVADPHVDFAGRMVPGKNLADPVNPTDDTYDECINEGSFFYGHGTHVAGIAAATGDNGTGVAGVTWGASIMPVRVLGAPGEPACTGPPSAAAAGIIWAVDNGADVCNLSLQFYYEEPSNPAVLENAVDYAYAQGALVVAAAGNNVGYIAYPARYANCMAVTATDNADAFASFSNSGPEVDVCAPGEEVYSTMLDDSYGEGNGTSMSTPHVSGLAALIKSYVPGLSNDEIWTILTDMADDLGVTGWDQYYGHGRINAEAALIAAGATTVRVISSDPPSGAVDARQPSETDGTDPAGWSSATLTFNGDPSALLIEDFSVETEGSEDTPQILSVSPAGPNAVTVTLDSTIPIGAWTTIRHDYSGTGVRLGYLPGDVDGDLTSAPADILEVIDGLNGVTPLEIWKSDVDRDGTPAPADILRVIDLLNGAGVYDVYNGMTLP